MNGNYAEMVKKRKAAESAWALASDLKTVYRMDSMDSNFYGMRQLMPLIETLAYIAMEEIWPKPKQ